MTDISSLLEFGPGVGYTLGTGRLFCEMGEFHRFAEAVLGRPILTHEFGSSKVWQEVREAFETHVLETLGDHDDPETGRV